MENSSERANGTKPPTGALRRALFAATILMGLVAAGLGAEWARLLYAAPRVEPNVPPMVAAIKASAQKPEHGSLVICGGGNTPDEVRQAFIALAGGPHAHLIVIPTAHGTINATTSARDLAPWRLKGVDTLEVFHTRSRQQANDPDFVKPLAKATGVWLAGGKQTLLTEAYAGTLVEGQLKSLLQRGGVIGGTSAGAAVMTRVMIDGGRDQAVEGTGFDFFPGSVVDQHFMKRNRVGRLLGLLTRHPGLIGFGIDEGTALVVRGDHLTVLGESYVMACLPGDLGHPTRLQVLKRGDMTELNALRADSGSITSALDLDEALSGSKTAQGRGEAWEARENRGTDESLGRG
ncbi:MAG TPA: cyanophycinase, partial [Isosphaeraceae bacterium]|nr:cyanophycinase [Isosphaeraceae bacterium]